MSYNIEDTKMAAQLELALSKSESGSTQELENVGTPKEERRVILKQDLVLLPLLSFSYFFGYLVRSTTSENFNLTSAGSRPDWQRSRPRNAKGPSPDRPRVLQHHHDVLRGLHADRTACWSGSPILPSTLRVLRCSSRLRCLRDLSVCIWRLYWSYRLQTDHWFRRGVHQQCLAYDQCLVQAERACIAVR